MKIEEQTQGAVTILKAVGPLIGDEAIGLGTRLAQTRQKTMGRYVLDAAGISFVDSAGLEILLDASEQQVDCGRNFKICSANATLREVIELTGLSEFFEYFDDTNTAVRSFL